MKKISKQTKIIIVLILASLGVLCITVAFWYGTRKILFENPRLCIRNVQLECASGYWSGKTEEERAEKTRKFCELVGIVPGKTNFFERDLASLHRQILTDQPEIETLTISRILPDTVCFHIRNRVPRADVGGGFYLDDSGVFLRAKYYSGEDSKGLAILADKELREERLREPRTRNAEVLAALKFLRFVATSGDPSLQEIRIQSVVVIRTKMSRYIQIKLFYRDDSTPYQVRLLPAEFGEDLTLRRIVERLIPALNDLRGKPESQRLIDLRYSGPAFSPSR